MAPSSPEGSRATGCPATCRGAASSGPDASGNACWSSTGRPPGAAQRAPSALAGPECSASAQGRAGRATRARSRRQKGGSG
eukprot:7971463-Pyramimonas_sp.AAC.1